MANAIIHVTNILFHDRNGKALARITCTGDNSGYGEKELTIDCNQLAKKNVEVRRMDRGTEYLQNSIGGKILYMLPENYELYVEWAMHNNVVAKDQQVSTI